MYCTACTVRKGGRKEKEKGVEFLNVNRWKVVRESCRWKTASVHARERRGCWWAGIGAFILGPGSFSSSEPWPQIFPLRSALIGHRAGNARRFHCRPPPSHNAALPLQLSRRKQISNVALNKPVGNVPWYSRARPGSGCYWGEVDRRVRTMETADRDSKYA